MPVDVRLASGEEPVIVFDADGESEVAVALPGLVLPEPEVEGSVALYRDVLPGVDVSVEVRSAGFQVLWVVRSADAAQALVTRFGDEKGNVRLPAEVLTAGGASKTKRGTSSLFRVAELAS